MKTLRPYQIANVLEVISLWMQSNAFPIVQCATGLGKTAIIAGLCSRLTASYRGRRIVILAHRRPLIQQAKNSIAEFAPQLKDDIGMVMGGHADYGARVIVMTVQSATKKAVKAILAHGEIGAVIVDEVHHAHNTSYQNAIRAFAPLYVGGVTATPYLPDGAPLPIPNAVLVGKQDLLWGITNRYLSPIKALEVGTEIDVSGVRKWGKDFRDRELSAVTETANALDLAVKAWREWGESRPTIAFVSTVRGAETLARLFNNRGIKATTITEATPDDKREQAKSDLASGAIKIAVTVGVWTEGVDVPCVQCLLMCRPTLSKVLYVQMLGRGTRLCEGKKNLLVLDLCPKGSEDKGAVTTRSLGFAARHVGRAVGTPKSRAKWQRKPKPVGGRLVARERHAVEERSFDFFSSAGRLIDSMLKGFR